MEDGKFKAIQVPSSIKSSSDPSLTAPQRLIAGENGNVLDYGQFLSITEEDAANLSFYSAPASKEMYRNFLDWLFATFGVEELDFRRGLIAKLNLKSGSKVLITGCGFGDDVLLCMESVGDLGEVHAQDLSKEMVHAAARAYPAKNALYTISNALDLPYRDRYFDGVFHFGGINLFGDMARAVKEMERVCKIGGRVVFGDEGIAPHLRGTEYGKVAISNIDIWKASAPLEKLPSNAEEISLSYVLGNCFYIIEFSVGEGLPKMNIDVEHKGLRGGTARSRYYGRIEGVTISAKEKLYQAARARNTSVHRLLSDLIDEAIPD
ncbi:class I SAM-dependent methyltransferase [Neorhizobium galegae]|nr:methyltransferase domain-containing protein [Neorhizobium galegae]MCQ1798473.1 methyltransferase domain-containing protein [Neorhizobium galegae]